MSPRRNLLLAVPVLLAHRTAARAQPKMSRGEAQYQDTPRGGLSCQVCTFFRRPASCQVVDGDVSPQGWCRLFDLPD